MAKMINESENEIKGWARNLEWLVNEKVGRVARCCANDDLEMAQAELEDIKDITLTLVRLTNYFDGLASLSTRLMGNATALIEKKRALEEKRAS